MPDGAGPSIAPATAGSDSKQGESRAGWRRLLPFLNGGSSADPDTNAETAVVESAGASASEREMIARIVAFRKMRVDDVAIPRADIQAVDVTIDFDELIRTLSSANHSRLPVYRGDLDDPIGMVHIKDVIGMLAQRDTGTAPEPVSTLVRDLLYVPPSMSVTELLLRMQASRVHMALVIDEFGGTDGLVTIEDLIEQIVGDIRDEHDAADEFVLRQVSDHRWDVDPRVPLDELSELIGFEFSLEDHDADTLGGLVFSLAGRVPLRGEVIPHPAGPDFDISDADPRRINRIIIRMKPSPRAVANDSAGLAS